MHLSGYALQGLHTDISGGTHCHALTLLAIPKVEDYVHTLRIPADEPSLPEPLASSAAALEAAVPLCCMASSSTLRFLCQCMPASEMRLTVAGRANFMLPL